MRGRPFLFSLWLVCTYARSSTLQDFQAIIPCSADTPLAPISTTFRPATPPPPQMTGDIFRPPSLLPIPISCADLTKITIPNSSADGDTSGESKKVEHVGTIPGLWAVVTLSVTLFLSWLCWEVWKDWKEMLWLEHELKCPPLSHGGGILQQRLV
jgi:hypothetical protein